MGEFAIGQSVLRREDPRLLQAVGLILVDEQEQNRPDEADNERIEQIRIHVRELPPPSCGRLRRREKALLEDRIGVHDLSVVNGACGLA